MLNITRIENDINNELDKIIKVFSSYNDFKQLPEYTRKIKLFIDDILKIQINKFLNKEISNSVFDKRYNRIIIDGVILTTSILSQSNDNTLSIKISEGKENESYAVIPNISLNESAPWVKLDITCHEKISQYNKDIAHIAQTVINTGYTRLEMFVCGCIKKEEEDFIIEIYKLARQRLPIEFHDKIFFFFIGKEHSKYWFDERAMNAVLKQAKKLKKNRYITPSDTLSELVYSSVPSKLTRGYNEVIPQDKAIAFNPLKIETAKHGIGLSQHILFRSHSFVSQPIVGVELGPLDTHGRWLVITYEEQYKEKIEKKIYSIRDKIREVVLSNYVKLSLNYGTRHCDDFNEVNSKDGVNKIKQPPRRQRVNKDLNNGTNVNVTIGEFVMGDKIIAHGNNNIIVNRSSVLNAFNKIKDQYNEETANYLICIEKEINKSGNKEAIENYEAFTNELSKPAPLKSLLKSLWQGTVIALPTIVELAGAVESIEKLFN